ncbi:MAG: DUF748 domain-containing protein [Halopseudomonas sp.]
MINRKPLLISTAVIVTLVLLISFAPALVLKYQLNKQMRLLGADQVGVESLYLNPWTGYIELKGLSATATDRPALAIGHLLAEISYRALWSKRIEVTQLQLANIELHLQQPEQQWLLGPLLLPAPEPSSEPDQEPSKWRAGINGFSLANINASLTTPQMSQRLVIDQADLQRLHQWTPQQQTQLKLEGQINDSLISLGTHGTPLASQPQIEIELKLEKLALEPLASPWLKGLKGDLSTDLMLQLELLEDGLKLDQSGTLSLTDFGLSQASLAVSSAQIDWQGSAQQQLTGGALVQANTDTKLQIQQLAVQLEQPELALQEQSLLLDGRIEATGTQQFSFDGLFSSGEAQIKMPELLVANQARSWQGRIDLSLTEQGLGQLVTNGVVQLQQLQLEQAGLKLTEQQIELKGRLETDAKQLSFDGGLQTQPSQINFQQLQIATQARQWQGALGVDLASAAVTSFSGDISVDSVQVKHQDGNALVAFEQLNLNQIQLPQPNQLDATSLQLQQLVLGGEQPLLALDKLSINGISSSPTRTHINQIHPSEIKARFDLDGDKKPYRWLAWLAQLTGSQASADKADADAKPQQTANDDSSPYPFKLNQFALQQPAQITITEQSPTTKKPGRPLNTTIEVLTLADVDTSSDQVSPFKLNARTHRFGYVELEGNYALFAESPNALWQGNISGMALPPFSRMMRSQTGYQIESGKLELQTQGTITTGLVDSTNHVVINNLSVKPATKDSTTEFDGKLGMPLGTAVSLLTDSDDNVELDLPIKGKLSDPEFGIQSVLNIVMLKVTREAAVGYLALTLQPYGAILGLGRLAMDAAGGSGINLEPIHFEPGSAQLTPQGVDYLSKIGKMLADRDGLRLKLCGQSVAADKAWLISQRPAPKPQPQTTASAAQPSMPIALTEQEHNALIQLAEERGFSVKTHLLAQHKVKDGQLFSCLANVDTQVEAPPSVKLGL